jgi:hypothetical protein
VQSEELQSGRGDRPIRSFVSHQEPTQPALPFEPPLGGRFEIREEAGDELSLDRFAELLLQEVVLRSAALDVREVRRRDPRHAA